MNEIEEIFVDIDGYEGLYQISNLGRVKSLKYGREKILKFGKDRYGYLYVILCKNGKSKNCKIHRLVAQAFINNPNNLPMINHKDEDKTNNIVDNLEWCTQQYNINYGTAMQRMVANTDYKARTAKMDYKSFQSKRVANTDYKAISEKQINDPNKSKKVYQYSKDGELIKIWESTAECGRNGYNQGHVASCCRGKLKTHKGYIWSYEELKK